MDDETIEETTQVDAVLEFGDDGGTRVTSRPAVWVKPAPASDEEETTAE